jgi:L-lysine exporter family protein LysE/ArgO
MDSVILEGMLLQASLIFALGAQNLFVLEAGLKKMHPLAVSFTCFICDFFLIMLGVAGTATLLAQFYQFKIIFGVLGVLFMFFYGWNKLHSSTSDFSFYDIKSNDRSFRKAIILSFTFSIFNPHAYLDAIVLIGGYSTKYEFISDRISIGIGASLFSLFWFLLLSFASSVMRPLFVNPRRMKLVMSFSGLILIVLSAKLSTEVYSWVFEMINDPNCSFFGTCSPVLQADASSN